MRNFHSLADYSAAEIRELLALAARLARQPEPDALRGRVLGLLFFNPSLRTLASFQSAMARLGGSSFVIAPGQGSWQIETRDGVVMNGAAAEHVREAIPVLASYADALGIRAFAGGTDLAHDLADTSFRKMADLAGIPTINLESACDHPCQALADWKTLDDLGIPPAPLPPGDGPGVRADRPGVRAARGKFVLTWANHPKALPLAVPTAAAHMAALRGMDLVILRPEEYALPAAVMARVRAAATASGGSVRETADRGDALAGADALYAKSWASPTHYGDVEAEARLRAGLAAWCVDEDWFAPAAPGCRFLHCLPVRRNVVVADRVLDSWRSVVVQQAQNRMWVQMAVLHRLLATSRSTARPSSGVPS
jgi:N-acetylornithine carbamoyltransferase